MGDVIPINRNLNKRQFAPKPPGEGPGKVIQGPWKKPEETVNKSLAAKTFTGDTTSPEYSRWLNTLTLDEFRAHAEEERGKIEEMLREHRKEFPLKMLGEPGPSSKPGDWG